MQGRMFIALRSCALCGEALTVTFYDDDVLHSGCPNDPGMQPFLAGG